MNELYTARQIAERADISKQAVQKAIKARSIQPAKQYGQAMLYTAEDAETIIKAAQEHREFTENHRQPIPTNDRQPLETNDRQPPETEDNQQAREQPETVDTSGKAAETTADNLPATTDNQQEPTADNRQPTTEPQQEHTSADAAGADHDQQDTTARYIESLERQVADLTERLDRAEQRVDLLLATVYRQAAAALPAPKQPKQHGKIWHLFFNERR